MNLDYTAQGRRPSVRQIIADWKKGGQPPHFTVEYGETFAEFQRLGARWDDSGNGCRGVPRNEVAVALGQAA